MPRTRVIYQIGRTPNFDGWNLFPEVKKRKEAWEARCRKTLDFPGKMTKEDVIKQVIRRGGNKHTMKIEYLD